VAKNFAICRVSWVIFIGPFQFISYFHQKFPFLIIESEKKDQGKRIASGDFEE